MHIYIYIYKYKWIPPLWTRLLCNSEISLKLTFNGKKKKKRVQPGKNISLIPLKIPSK